MPPPPPPPLAAAKANRAALRLAVACLLLAVTWLLAVGRTEMGSAGSKAEGSGSAQGGWQPGAPGQPRIYSASGFDITPLTTEERIEAARGLTDFQRYVTLQAGTERAFTGTTVDGAAHDNKRKGVYVCAIGGLPLFTSETKFNSGTGWPSYWQPVDPQHIVEKTDTSIPFMPRVEVLCARSGAHLGHVFPDGPKPTGKRYCINAAALRFIPEGSDEMPKPERPPQ